MAASKLRSLRVARQLAIQAVAVRAGVGPGTIVAIERHGHTPRVETKLKIAKALGVDVVAIWPSGDQPDSSTAA